MTRRLLFAAALLAGVALALAGWWLIAVAVQMLPAYLAGGWVRARKDADRIACLTADLDAALGRNAALEDEQAAWWGRHSLSRWVDDRALMPDNRPYRSAVDHRNDPSPTSAAQVASRPAGTPLSPSF